MSIVIKAWKKIFMAVIQCAILTKNLKAFPGIGICSSGPAARFSLRPTRLDPRESAYSVSVLNGLAEEESDGGTSDASIEDPIVIDDTLDHKFRDSKFVARNQRWVIVVDDEEDIRLAVGDYLYDSGYEVTACSDADSLLDICAKPRADGELPTIPDAIISDVRMPGKDGLELLGLIRSDERLARVPVVLLTAKGMTEDRILGYKAGADVYLPKPFDPEELLCITDNLIKRRQQMSGTKGNLMDLKQDMETIKQIMRRNSVSVVKKTDVYLSDSERDTLELICKGYTNAEIAEERGGSVLGVNRVIQKMYMDTQTRTRTELVRWAITTGYVSRRRS